MTACAADTADRLSDTSDGADSNDISKSAEETVSGEDNGNDMKTGDRKWTLGYGSAEIIPDGYNAETGRFDSVYYVAGYRNGNEATGMLDPQCARAVYISDNLGNNIVMAAVDCVGLAREDIAKIREKLTDVAEKYNISAIHIAATHTHAGCDTLGLWGPVGYDGKNEAFMEKLIDRTQYAIRMAVENIREGEMFFGSADTPGMQRDSRPPQVYDTNIYRMRFVPSDGSAGVQIINYGAHPEALRSENSKISADYPAYIGKKIKEETGDDYVFFAGALGGLIMTHRQKNETGTEYPVEKNVVVTGEILAGYVLGIKNEIKINPAISSATRVFDIDLDNQLYVTMSFLGILSAKPVEGGGEFKLAMRTEATLLRLGSGESSVSIAMVPGEIFPELVYGGDAGDIAANPEMQNPATLSDITGAENLLVFGLCNDEIGYIVAPNDYLLHETNPFLEEGTDKFGRSHYEETNSVGLGAARMITDMFAALAAELEGK